MDGKGYRSRDYTGQRMRIWLDTEFNEFRGELISMALVTEDGREWYEVLDCDNPGPWVAVNVMPILGKRPVSSLALSYSLQEFLSGYDSVLIIADWPEDIAHFCSALIVGPGQCIKTPKMFFEVCRDIEGKSELPHNALADARAIKAECLELETD